MLNNLFYSIYFKDLHGVSLQNIYKNFVEQLKPPDLHDISWFYYNWYTYFKFQNIPVSKLYHTSSYIPHVKRIFSLKDARISKKIFKINMGIDLY